jgi:rifampicin phosphotransferase
VNAFVLGPMAQRYLDTLDEVRRRMAGKDLAALGGHELVELLEDSMHRLLGPYAVAICNDFYAQQLYDLVARLLERWGVAEPASTRDALVAGEEDIHSIRPLRAVLALAERVKGDAGALALFASSLPPAVVLRRLSQPEHAGVLGAIGRYAAEFGDRTVQELELSTPSAEDDPSLVITMIRNALRAEHRPESEGRRAARAEAEVRVQAALGRSPARRAALDRALAGARRAVVLRENLRLARTRAYGVAKKILRALGALFARGRLLDAADDVFYLTLEEVVGAVRGSLVTRDLKGLVALRRREWAVYQDRRPAPRHFVRGVVAAHAFEPAAKAELDGGDELKGQGCSAGTAEAEACVVRDPTEPVEVRGRILVAPMTDPGWIFLMVAARGLVVEKGSLLSHTAIVGRELGLPTVVGVKDAAARIATGDRIAIDGRAGVVRIVERGRTTSSESEES